MINKATIIYDYIVQRKIFTYMSVRPLKYLVEKNLNGLGFKLENPGKPACQFKIDKISQNTNLLLMLSYYSM